MKNSNNKNNFSITFFKEYIKENYVSLIGFYKIALSEFRTAFKGELS